METGNLACPFFKRNPTHNMHCLYRNQLKSTSWVVQHIDRYHGPPKKTSPARDSCNYAADQEKQRQTCRTGECGQGRERLSQDQLEQLRQQGPHRRGLPTEEARWYHIWETIFPFQPRPKSPYVESPENEILRMTIRAIERVSPLGVFPGLQSLSDWSKVSSILENDSPDLPLNATPSEADSQSSYGSLSSYGSDSPYASPMTPEPLLQPQYSLGPTPSSHSAVRHCGDSTSLTTYGFAPLTEYGELDLLSFARPAGQKAYDDEFVLFDLPSYDFVVGSDSGFKVQGLLSQ